MTVGSGKVSLRVSPGLHGRYVEQVQKHVYSGAVALNTEKAMQKHRFGVSQVWPKESGFVGEFFEKQKWRPLSSYRFHVLKDVLSLAGKALLWVLFKVAPRNMITQSLNDVHRKTRQYNQDVTNSAAQQDAHTVYHITEVHKKDIDNFFCEADHKEFEVALRWLQSKHFCGKQDA